MDNGQATVESGFSVNKEVMGTNMQLMTLTSRRLVMDHLKDVGGVANIDLTKKLLDSCNSARSR